MGKPIDLTGLVFGKWYVVEKAKSPNGYEHCQYWLCRCECGAEQVRKGAQLRWADKKGLKQACMKCAGTKHGEYKSVEYITLRSMIDRCTNPNHEWFHRYGGRGISVCERWNDVHNFISDMGRRPSKYHSIDRINNDGNYEPNNCQWVTQSTQLRNTSVNRIIEFNGKSQCLKEWSEETGLSMSLIKGRIDNFQWSISDALTTPAGRACNWRGTQRRNADTLTFNGETLTHREWEKRIDAKKDTIRKRLKQGWTIERAITTPVGKYKQK